MVFRIAAIIDSSLGEHIVAGARPLTADPRSTASRYAVNVWLAVFSHENSSARFNPFFDNSLRSDSSSATRASASVISPTFRGLTSTAASPATSFIEELFDVITGVPHDIASTIGMPKPSSSEGYTNATAPLKRAGRYARGT